MIIRRFEVGPLMVNSYIIGCEKTRIAAIVDPGDESERLLDEAENLNLRLKQIINTHGHADHIAANGEIKEATGAKIYIHQADAEMLTDPAKNLSIYFGPAVLSPPPDGFLDESIPHYVGELKFKILHIPGHSPGSVCLVHNKHAIVGDTLFAGSIGRTDFPGGSHKLLIAGINRKIITLGDDVALLPGHGLPTTVKQERMHNPFLQEGF